VYGGREELIAGVVGVVQVYGELKLEIETTSWKDLSRADQCRYLLAMFRKHIGDPLGPEEPTEYYEAINDAWHTILQVVEDQSVYTLQSAMRVYWYLYHSVPHQGGNDVTAC